MHRTSNGESGVQQSIESEQRLTSPDGGPSPRLPLLIAALSTLAPFFIDTYLPSFGELGARLHASPLQVQQTLTAYLVPFAAMNLWHGALSDAMGRRRVVIGSLVVLLIASVGAALATSIEALMGFRVIQGAASGVGLVVGRAMVRDVYEGAQAQRVMAQVSALFAIAPAVAPVIGGWLHELFGWRSVFGFLAILSTLLLVWSHLGLPETLPAAQRHPLHLGRLLRSYLETMTDGAFLAAAGAATFNFLGVFLYISSAPRFLLEHLQLRETQFLWLFGPMTAGMMLGAAASGHLAGRLSPMRTLGAGYLLMLGAAAANGLFHALHGAAVPWSVLPIAVYSFGMALSMPTLTLLSLDLHPTRKGLASSCQAFLLTTGNAVTAGVLAPLLNTTPLRLAIGQLSLALVGLGFLGIFLHLSRRPTSRHPATV